MLNQNLCIQTYFFYCTQCEYCALKIRSCCKSKKQFSSIKGNQIQKKDFCRKALPYHSYSQLLCSVNQEDLAYQRLNYTYKNLLHEILKNLLKLCSCVLNSEQLTD